MNRFIANFCFGVSSALMAMLPAAALGQAQPDVADNNQDEQININRAVSENAELFKILRSGDKSEVTQYVTKVYQLQHANPYEIIPYIKSIVSLEKGSVSTAQNKAPDGTLRMWLQVNVPEYLLPFLDQAVASYDVPDFISAPGFVAFSYRSLYRDAVELESIIRRSVVTAEGKMTVDPETNIIYFQESPSDFRRVYGALRFYDIPVPQVDLRVRLIQLSDIDQSTLGLDWDAWKSSFSGDASALFTRNVVRPDTGETVATQGHTYEAFGSIGAQALAEFLNYMVDQGKAQYLVDTVLTVQNNETGVLLNASGIPVIDYVKNSEGQQERKQIGEEVESFRIQLTPTIATRQAELTVGIDINNPVGFSASGEPILSSSTVDSRLTLEPGRMVKLGGFKRSMIVTENQGLPGLRLIPGLKWLFSEETRDIRTGTAFLFIEPVWSAPLLPDRETIDFHHLVEPFEVDRLLRENPNLRMAPGDAEVLQRYFEDRASI